jgi:hypothetical protein
VDNVAQICSEIFLKVAQFSTGINTVVDETVASALPCAGQVGHEASPAGESSSPTVLSLTGAWHYVGPHWTVTGQISWVRAERRVAAACVEGQKR